MTNPIKHLCSKLNYNDHATLIEMNKLLEEYGSVKNLVTN